MPLARFLLWTFAGSTIWNAILAYAGLWLGANFEAINRYVGPAAIAMTVLMIGGYLWRVFTWKPRGER